MEKRKLKIINVLYLPEEKYNKIREYRNQEYIRKVCLNSNVITKEEHQFYKQLLEKREKHFAFLILNDEKDYGVITLKKEDEGIYIIGDYLVNELYKFEGGGIVNRFCINLLCNKLNIRFLKVEQQINNTRGNRAGIIAKIQDITYENEYFKSIVEVFDYNDERIVNAKSRKLFDKLYEITEYKLL